MARLAYVKLVRLPNAFTALADIGLGLLAGRCAGAPPVAAAALGAASACLYSAGMAFNDLCDLEQDRRERPQRPLPAGAVSLPAARRVAGGLFLAGLAFAGLAGAQSPAGPLPPLVVAGCLLACIVAYDAWLKRTPFGPLAMGGCRFLNVLLGLSLTPDDVVPWPVRLHLAAAVGGYIVGVTWLARTEARQSERRTLRAAGAVMLAGWLLALWVPGHLPPGTGTMALPLAWAAAVAWLGVAVVRACRSPAPGPVQAAVKRAIFALVVLDAVLASAFVGWPGLLLVLLLVPAAWLGKWVYST